MLPELDIWHVLKEIGGILLFAGCATAFILAVLTIWGLSLCKGGSKYCKWCGMKTYHEKIQEGEMDGKFECSICKAISKSK